MSMAIAILALFFKPADRHVNAAMKADIGGLVAAAVQPFDELIAIARRALIIKVEVAFRVALRHGGRQSIGFSLVYESARALDSGVGTERR